MSRQKFRCFLRSNAANKCSRYVKFVMKAKQPSAIPDHRKNAQRLNARYVIEIELTLALNIPSASIMWVANEAAPKRKAKKGSKENFHT